MTHDWLLVETLGAEPAVVAQGSLTKNLIPISAFLRRDPHLMAIQSAIGETVRAGNGLSSITPKNDLVIRTEVVQMTDGRIHGVHVWSGPPDLEPPERIVPGALKWDLTNRIATDTAESLCNSGMNPTVEATQGRAFAEDLPTRDLNPSETRVLAVAINPKPGRTFCSTWDVTDYEGNPIAVGFVARVLLESDGGPERMICRAMNWRAVRDRSTIVPHDLAQRILNGLAEPGVHRAIVDLRSWTLLKWLDEPCPFYDWRSRADGEPLAHPDDNDQVSAMVADFDRGPVSSVLRLRANGGGWTPVHVTVHRVELEDEVFGGLLSLRQPTDDELAEYEGRAKPRRSGRLTLKGRTART
ncbi:MAG TPA: PAS domain-containing protein [Mycobacterium sp.]|nr:PAS domain-containing protein [Mycobacterium sp.]